MQVAVDRLIDVRWTEAIHDEWIRNLASNVSTIPVERLQMTRRLMEAALPNAMVTGYERHIPSLNLPDPNDRHVVAAGIAAGASIILTLNLKDFPALELRKYCLRRQTPDAFLAELYDRAPELTLASLANARRNLSKSQVSASDFVGILRSQKLIQLAAKVVGHIGDL